MYAIVVINITLTCVHIGLAVVWPASFCSILGFLCVFEPRLSAPLLDRKQV